MARLDRASAETVFSSDNTARPDGVDTNSTLYLTTAGELLLLVEYSDSIPDELEDQIHEATGDLRERLSAIARAIQKTRRFLYLLTTEQAIRLVFEELTGSPRFCDMAMKLLVTKG